MKRKIVKASTHDNLICPFCNKKINASVLSSDSCEHLLWKDSKGQAEFKQE